MRWININETILLVLKVYLMSIIGHSSFKWVLLVLQILKNKHC